MGYSRGVGWSEAAVCPQEPRPPAALPSCFLTVSVAPFLFTSGPWPPGLGALAGQKEQVAVSGWLFLFLLLFAFNFKGLEGHSRLLIEQETNSVLRL